MRPSFYLYDKLPLAVQVIDQQVLTQVILVGVECAATIDLRHLVNKSHHPAIILEHEGIDSDAIACAALRFEQRLLLGEGVWRIAELPATILIPDGRPTIGYHDDLLVDSVMAREELARKHQPVRHVGARVVIETAHLYQFLRLVFAGDE